MRFIILILSAIVLISCSTRKEYYKFQDSSVFVKANELGSNKAAFISKYGQPINKDLKKEGNDIIESLYYLEDIKGVMVTTKMKFVNDKLVEQSNYKIDTVDKKLEELRTQLETNGRRINMLRRIK